MFESRLSRKPDRKILFYYASRVTRDNFYISLYCQCELYLNNLNLGIFLIIIELTFKI